jgi:YjbE family integral membrane protein
MVLSVLEFSWSWEFAASVLSITLINLSLSGDNAVVIGMAAASLPAQRRKLVIACGGLLAIILRIILTAIATLLLRIPLLSAVGGLVLFWIVWKLLRVDVSGSEEENKADTQRNMRQAIFLIVTADLMMSLDNVIAVAGSAHGDILLLVIGLLLSMPLLMVSGGIIAHFFDKLKWLIIIGGAVISFTGAKMIFEDELIESKLHPSGALVMVIAIVCGLAFPNIVILINRWRAKSMARHRVGPQSNP